jgi:hypothetical protein
MYQKNGVPYSNMELRHDNPNVSFPRNALENPDICSEYGVTKVPKSELPPTNVQPTEKESPSDGFLAVEGDPELVGDEWRQTWNYVEISWLDNRTNEYGRVENQIEFITENGLEAWQSRVSEIKAKYPKL